jgi:hypothetical protein
MDERSTPDSSERRHTSHKEGELSVCGPETRDDKATPFSHRHCAGDILLNEGSFNVEEQSSGEQDDF